MRWARRRCRPHRDPVPAAATAQPTHRPIPPRRRARSRVRSGKRSSGVMVNASCSGSEGSTRTRARTWCGCSRAKASPGPGVGVPDEHHRSGGIQRGCQDVADQARLALSPGGCAHGWHPPRPGRSARMQQTPGRFATTGCHTSSGSPRPASNSATIGASGGAPPPGCASREVAGHRHAQVLHGPVVRAVLQRGGHRARVVRGRGPGPSQTATSQRSSPPQTSQKSPT